MANTNPCGMANGTPHGFFSIRNGEAVRKKTQMGDAETYPTESAAQAVAAALCLEINVEVPRTVWRLYRSETS